MAPNAQAAMDGSNVQAADTQTANHNTQAGAIVNNCYVESMTIKVDVGPGSSSTIDVSGLISTSQGSVKKRTPLPNGRPQTSSLPTPPTSPRSAVTPPARASKSSSPARKQRKAKAPREEWALPCSGTFEIEEDCLRKIYRDGLKGEYRSNESWASEFRRGQSTALGLKRGEYPKCDVPGKKRHPGSVDKKKGKIGSVDIHYDLPGVAFAIYSVLAKVPGGWMTKQNILETIEEWLPNQAHEQGLPRTFEDQTYRRALSTRTIDGGHVFGHNDGHFWCILGVNEEWDHYLSKANSRKGASPWRTSNSASNASADSSPILAANSSELGIKKEEELSSIPATNASELGIKNEELSSNEGPPTKKQRTE